MGERILRGEGYEVITVSDGETAMLRLRDSAPALVIADVSMPFVTGYELCEYIKSSGQHSKTGVVERSARSNLSTRSAPKRSAPMAS